jgi:hypothetical protein
METPMVTAMSRMIDDRARILRPGISERRVEIEKVADAIPHP